VALPARFVWFGFVVALAGCASESLVPAPGGGDGDAGPAPDENRQLAESVLGAPGVPAAFLAIYEPSDGSSSRPLVPTGLAWNPTEPDELWITLREPPSDRTCESTTTVACTWLMGRVAIVHGAASAPGTAPEIQIKQDANAWHFMRRPTSIAFGSDDTFATCAEARTSNYEDEAVPFNGPALWSADPAIFGVAPPPKSPTGSTHIDMLHESPYCMGIAHERDNVYWTFNGDAGSLDRYDFHVPHAPGEDDHSDGELWRYGAGLLERVPDVPSHLAYDAELDRVYATDTGHGRVVTLDTTTGTPGAQVTTYDPIQTHVAMTGADIRPLVPPGTLAQPSGLTLHRGLLFVTDAASSSVFAFDRSGRVLATLDTGFPAGSLGGIGIGPDGRAYITDRSTGSVLRIDPGG
jgi:hypothetical protein